MKIATLTAAHASCTTRDSTASILRKSRVTTVFTAGLAMESLLTGQPAVIKPRSVTRTF